MQADESPYKILLDTLQTEDTKVSLHILNSKNNVKFKLEIFALKVKKSQVMCNTFLSLLQCVLNWENSENRTDVLVCSFAGKYSQT